MTDFLHIRWAMPMARINLMILRASLIFLVLGSAMTAAAQSIPALIGGMTFINRLVAYTDPFQPRACFQLALVYAHHFLLSHLHISARRLTQENSTQYCQ